MSALDNDRPVVVVDDQLALFAALQMLPVADGAMIVTTYAWQQRILGAFVAPRSTSGQLQRIAAHASVSAATVLEAVGSPDPANLIVADPRATAVDIARRRVTGANALAAETIAAAKSYRASVRVSTGNGHGHLADRVEQAGIDFAVWDTFEPS